MVNNKHTIVRSILFIFVVFRVVFIVLFVFVLCCLVPNVACVS